MLQIRQRGNLLKILGIFLVLFSTLPLCAEKTVVKKVLFFGDSTTGWLADRLQAYGDKNGFDVAAITWDGATMKKYANNSAKLKQYINKEHPNAIFISLGMNDMGASKPEVLFADALAKIRSAIGNIPIIWIGPASWPGFPKRGPAYNSWMTSQLGAGHYFVSHNLELPRQSRTNPHPTRAGVNKWMDAVVSWIKSGKAAVSLPGYATPDKSYSRPKSNTYKRMRESL